MSVTNLYTTRNLVRQAFRKIGIAGIGEDLAGEDYAQGLIELNMMLKSWQARGLCRWLRATQSVTLTTAASYTMNPVRPMTVDSVRFKKNGVETPLTHMTGEEYDSLPIKTTTGIPTSYFYDRQREDARLYIWPVLAAATGETLEITYTREIEDVTPDTAVVDVPGEWWEAVVYGLAARLADTYEVQSDRVAQRASQLLFDAMAFDREESVYFGETAPYSAY